MTIATRRTGRDANIRANEMRWVRLGGHVFETAAILDVASAETDPTKRILLEGGRPLDRRFE
jgi:hypothetical protein